MEGLNEKSKPVPRRGGGDPMMISRKLVEMICSPQGRG